MYGLVPFGRMNQEFRNLFDDMERTMFPAVQMQMPAFRTDIQDAGDHYLLKADLPGMNKEDIELKLEHNMLTISAKHEEKKEESKEDGTYICRERRVGSFQRTFDMTGIQEDAISASYENGVLTLTLPKQSEAPKTSSTISIQ